MNSRYYQLIWRYQRIDTVRHCFLIASSTFIIESSIDVPTQQCQNVLPWSIIQYKAIGRWKTYYSHQHRCPKAWHLGTTADTSFSVKPKFAKHSSASALGFRQELFLGTRCRVSVSIPLAWDVSSVEYTWKFTEGLSNLALILPDFTSFFICKTFSSLSLGLVHPTDGSATYRMRIIALCSAELAVS